MSEASQRANGAIAGLSGNGLVPRLLRRLPMVVWLTAMWVVLWGEPTVGTVLAGAMVGSGCYAAAKLPRVPVRLGWRPLGLFKLGAVFTYDIFVSSVHVAYHTLWRPRSVRGAIVAVPVRTESDLLLAMTAGGLSLVTGSLVIELNREQGVLYVHGLPIDSHNSVDKFRAQVRRTEELFVRAFGTAADIAEFERAENDTAGDPGPDSGEGTR